MPNWAYSLYIAVGEKKQIKKLHSTMSELEHMKKPLVENGFGTTWLGCLVSKLGGNPEKIYCRGSWESLALNDCSLSFGVESAWDELNEVREFIEEKFPGIKLYYQCEEGGNCVYKTNDADGEFFPDKYYFWYEDNDSIYHETLEDLIKDVEDVTGSKHLRTLDACRKAMETYSLKNHDLCYTLEEFKVVN